MIAGDLSSNITKNGGERGKRLQDSTYSRAFATFVDWNIMPALEALYERGARPPTVEEARAVLPERILAALALARPKI